MNRWDDPDGLGSLLTETFRTREQLADPERARALAAQVADGAPEARTHRHWPTYVAAAAAVALVAVLGAGVVRLGGDPAPVAPGGTASDASAGAAATYAGNRALAAAEARRVVDLVPLPEGARRLAGEPDGWPERGTSSTGPSDPSLTSTAWWSVPATAAALRSRLTHVAPPGMHRAGSTGWSSDGAGHVLRYVSFVQDRAPRPGAYVPVTLLVQWAAAGDRTLVRADTSTAARAVRTAGTRVTGEVTSVDVRHDGADPRSSTTVESPDQVRMLTDAVDGLAPSAQRTSAVGCPATRPHGVPTWTLTFHTDSGPVVVHWQELCDRQVEVRRDGVLQRPTLDPGELSEVLERVMP